MNILIVSATRKEIEPLAGSLIDCGQSGNMLYRKNSFHEIELLITGVGILSTAYWLTRTLKEKEYDLVINAGVCGSFQQDLQIGDVLQIIEESLPELGAETANNSFLSIFDLKLIEDSMFPFQDGRLVNEVWKKIKGAGEVKAAKGITVNTVHGTKESIEEILARTEADVESMEGATVFYVCLNEEIPFCEIRSVSNYVEPRNQSNWNIPLAVANLNQFLLTLLNQENLLDD